MAVKRVTFKEENTVHEMLSPDDYNRSQAQSVLYKRGYNKISNTVWQRISRDLEFFKQREMSVHIDNV